MMLLITWFILGNSNVSESQGFNSPEDTAIWQPYQNSPSSAAPNTSALLALRSLEDIENLIINTFPGGAVLEGKLLSPDDMHRVALLSESVENVLNLCVLHPEALRIAATNLEKILSQNWINNLKLSPLGNALLLTGTPVEEGDISRIQRICDSLHIPLINGTRSIIADPRMILFEVSFIEVNKDTFSDFGIKWPSSTTFSDISGMRVGRMESTNDLEITLDHQVLTGKARIISKPRLICSSGQKASFQAGGEIPIPRSNSEGEISVTWKPYGIILEIAPSISTESKIHIQIRSEVSMIDHANAIDGVPGILTRKVDTFLSLETGQTVVLSGLVHSDDAKNIQKIPFLGDIPIFGELFKSRSFQKRETELVVFLTPLPAPEGPQTDDSWQPEKTVEQSDIYSGPH